MSSRFDELVFELASTGCEAWEDLTPANRAKLVRLYFDEYAEWGDALYGSLMPGLMNAFESGDMAEFGAWVSSMMYAYVRPYVEKQLNYQAMCKREREELRA